MKINCGPTKEIKEKLKKEAKLAWVNKVTSEGEVVFAWLPIRLGENDCRWLERVKRTLIGYIDVWGEEMMGTPGLRNHVAEGRTPIWKYEAIQQE